MPKNKECRICWERLPLEKFQFTKDPSYKDGRLNWCLTCVAAYGRHRRAEMKKKCALIESAGFVLKFD